MIIEKNEEAKEATQEWSGVYGPARGIGLSLGQTRAEAQELPDLQTRGPTSLAFLVRLGDESHRTTLTAGNAFRSRPLWIVSTVEF